MGGCVYGWVCSWVRVWVGVSMGVCVACVLHSCLTKLLSTDQQDKTIVQVY